MRYRLTSFLYIIQNYIMHEINSELSTAGWWRNKRRNFHKGLIIACASSYFIFIAVYFYFPLLPDPEFKLPLIGPEETLYLFGIVVAHIFYYTGPILERIIKPDNLWNYRMLFHKFAYFYTVITPFIIKGYFTYWEYQEEVWLHSCTC